MSKKWGGGRGSGLDGRADGAMLVAMRALTRPDQQTKGLLHRARGTWQGRGGDDEI